MGRRTDATPTASTTARLPGAQERGVTRRVRSQPRASIRLTVTTIAGSTVAKATTPEAHRRGRPAGLIT